MESQCNYLLFYNKIITSLLWHLWLSRVLFSCASDIITINCKLLTRIYVNTLATCGNDSHAISFYP